MNYNICVCNSWGRIVAIRVLTWSRFKTRVKVRKAGGFTTWAALTIRIDETDVDEEDWLIYFMPKGLGIPFIVRLYIHVYVYYNSCITRTYVRGLAEKYFLGTYFTNAKLYSSSKRFQLSRMAVNKSSLLDGALS